MTKSQEQKRDAKFTHESIMKLLRMLPREDIVDVSSTESGHRLVEDEESLDLEKFGHGVSVD